MGTGFELQVSPSNHETCNLSFVTRSQPMIKPTALTIAGSDSGGGAGIQADLKAFEANGAFGMSVITAVTAQNTQEVRGVYEIPIAMIVSQIDAVAEDLPIGAVKTGMLSSAAIIETVVAAVDRHALHPLVVDPVMISKSGYALLQSDAVDALRTNLLPQADLVTPNANEVAALTGMEPLETLDDARRSAEMILEMGPQAVLVKGGHLAGEDDAVDVLLRPEGERVLREKRIDTPHTHGTGCTYASAITAHLAYGRDLEEAVRRARAYLQGAIQNALPLGGGHGPTNHFWIFEGKQRDGMGDGEKGGVGDSHP